MKLTFKFKPKIDHKQLEIIKELSWHTSKLYNIANYKIRNKDKKPIYSRMDKYFRDNWHCRYLHSHNRQHCFKQLAQDWKSFFNSIKDYKNNPNKYKATPRPPKFKHMNKNPNDVVFTNQAVKVKKNKLLFSLSKKIKEKYVVKNLKFELPEAVQSYINLDDLQQIRIKKDKLSKSWYLLIIYKTAEKKKEKNNNKKSNIMAIDLGLNNLATLTFKDNVESYIINGKPVKSKNAYFNKEIARLSRIRMKQVGSRKFKNTKNIKRLRLKRRNYVNDYLHKASRKIVDLALKHKVKTIVIGDIKDIKQNMNYNKSFVQVPIQKLVEMIEYKANLEDINIVKINESFTSGCSAINLEKLSRKSYNKSRRIERGLFKTDNKIINADVNGSLNILRKYLKDKCIPEMIKKIRDNGLVNSPSRLRVS